MSFGGECGSCAVGSLDEFGNVGIGGRKDFIVECHIGSGIGSSCWAGIVVWIMHIVRIILRIVVWIVDIHNVAIGSIIRISTIPTSI